MASAPTGVSGIRDMTILPYCTLVPATRKAFLRRRPRRPRRPRRAGPHSRRALPHGRLHSAVDRLPAAARRRPGSAAAPSSRRPSRPRRDRLLHAARARGEGLRQDHREPAARPRLPDRPSLTLWAKTLPYENASTAILRSLGFRHIGSTTDHEIGEAWEWELRRSPLRSSHFAERNGEGTVPAKAGMVEGSW
jgi:hypothetical protein